MTLLNFDAFDSTIRAWIIKIADLADKHAIKAYVVGGTVRDALLCRSSLDLDIVIEGNAIEFAQKFANLYKGQLIKHAVFGTAQVTLPSAMTIDFVTARREIYSKPGALPDVTASTIADDLFRRDFTVNAIACCINKAHRGLIVDPYCGVDDLKRKVLRVMHERSFIDDPTRLLRAVRYEARLGFKLESHSLIFFKQAVVQKAWLAVKPQRYFAEFICVLAEPKALIAVKRLHQLRALHVPMMNMQYSLLRMNALKKALPLAKAYDVTDPLPLWLSVLHDHHRPDDLLFALEHLGIHREYITSVVHSLDIGKIIGALTVKHISRWDVYSHLKSYYAPVLCLAFVQAQGVAKKRIKQFITKDKHFTLKIDGNDIKTLGVKEGIQVKRLLEYVTQQSINHQELTKAGQLRLAKAFTE